MLLGKRVITLDNEQGFVSCIYECSVDVDILEDEAQTAEHTTTINYNNGVIIPCPDQTPQLNDITPYGQVVVLGVASDGIIEVVLNRGYDRVSTLWLSQQRLNTLPKDCELEWGHWTDPKDFEKWVDYHDLRFVDHKIVPKFMSREDTPYESHLRVEFPDKDTEFWNCRVDESGQIDYVKTDDGEKLTTLEELREKGITSAELQCSYAIEDFDRGALC